jgi:hypothetical protein
MVGFQKWCLATFVLGLLAGLAAPALAAETKGSIKTFFPDKKEIVLTDGHSNDVMFSIADSCKVLINGKETQLADLLTGEEVTLTYEAQGQRRVVQEIRCKRD